jgi:S1-C subfamily serine protease
LESKQAKSLGIQSGVLVLDVPENSPACKAGLRGTRRAESGLIELGDILVKVGETIINTESDLFRALETYKPGDQIKVTINRVEVSAEDGLSARSSLATLVLTIPLQSSVDVEKRLNLYQVPDVVMPQ